MTDSVFHKLAKVDLKGITEKKDKFTYLSWAFAVEQMLSNYPEATWEIVKHPLLQNPEVGVPYLETPTGFYVETTVTIEGVTRSHIHPVLNHRNQKLDKPTNFDINTSAMRCLAKTIAMHGLGLYIYAGEDVPTLVDKFTTEDYEMFIFGLNGDPDNEDNDTSMILASMARFMTDAYNAVLEDHMEDHKQNKTLTAEKKRIRERLEAGNDLASETAVKLAEAIEAGDDFKILETVEPMTVYEKKLVWERIDPESQDEIRSILSHKEAA